MSFVIRRPAARCVLLDGAGRVFLIRSEDPIDPHKPEWLEIPGGGVGYGEDPATACRRELCEETGITDVEMGPCVWTQYVEYTFSGMRFESHERIYVAWCDGGEFRPRGLEALEAAAFIGARWWTLDELLANSEPTVPARLREVNEGRLADLVIVCTGAPPALDQALQSVERGGTVLFFAPTEPGVSVSVPVNDVFFRNDATLTTTYAGAPADLGTAMELIASGRVQVGQMISHRLGLGDASLGFKLTADAKESLKVIIEPQR